MMNGTSSVPRIWVIRASGPMKTRQTATVRMLEITMVHTIASVTARCPFGAGVSIAGPGTRPWTKKAPMRIAVATPAGPAHSERSDARPRERHLDQLRNGVEADRDGDEPDPVPEEELTEGVALDAGYRIESDRGQPEAEPSGQQPLHERLAAQRGDEGDAEQGQHEELRRAEGEHERPHDGNREPEDQGAEHRADERAHHRGAEGPAGPAVLRHGV